MEADEATLALPDAWTETAHEEGVFGPGEKRGVHVAFESGSMRVAVLPVQYECRGGVESLYALAGAAGDRTRFERRAAGAYARDCPRRIASAVVVTAAPLGDRGLSVFAVTADPGDAVAAGVWLARGADDDRGLRRNVAYHRGEPLAASEPAISDDDALGALFRADPDRCVVTGQPTRSHALALPYRYYPLLAGARTTPRGVPRVPSTVDALAGAVAHDAWTDGVADLPFDAPLEREAPGEYRLDADVAAFARDVDAGDLALRRLGA